MTSPPDSASQPTVSDGRSIRGQSSPAESADADGCAPQPEGGWLALVATPIGNLEDVTLRALRVLGEADLVAAEDTRRARRLLTHYSISARLESYHAHNEHRKTAHLLDLVEQGRGVAVLSDAGTPAVSDPGFLVVRQALARGIEPLVVPGVSALTHAVVAAGLPVDRFAFVGFPPVKAGRRSAFVSGLVRHDATVFIFEAPHRIEKLLAEISLQFGSDTHVAIVREATKLHEECIRGAVGDMLVEHAGRRWRGELVVAVDLRDRAAGTVVE